MTEGIDPLPGNTGAEFPDSRLRQARNRLLNYLDALDTPPHEATELTLHVLDQIRGRIMTGTVEDPVAFAMQHIRRILAEKNRIDPSGCIRMIPESAVSLPPAPPLNIGHMVPQKLESHMFTRSAAAVRIALPYAGILILLALIYLLTF